MALTLNHSQVVILRALAKAGPTGMTIEKLKAKVGDEGSVNAGTLGPVFLETVANYPDSLVGLKMVKVAHNSNGLDGKDLPPQFSITASGKKAAETFVTRTVPAVIADLSTAALDKAVKALKAKRTYGLELFTTDDLNEIRTAMNGTAKDVSDEELRLRICNRRKQGAYTNPEEKAGRAAKAALNAFGPNGTVKKNLFDPKTVAALEKLIG